MPRYDAVLFDVDGTLIHSRPGIIDTFSYVFARMGVDVSSVDLTRYLGPPLRRSFGNHFSDPARIEEAVSLYRRRYAEVGIHQCSVFPGVETMLQTLRAAGVLLATATSKESAVAARVLEEQGLLPYFDLLGGASADASVDTKTAVIRQDLADPRLRGKRVLMVGDRQDDLRGAADCALPAAAVLYGYGSLAELAPWRPVLLAESCADVTRFVCAAPTEKDVTM